MNPDKENQNIECRERGLNDPVFAYDVRGLQITFTADLSGKVSGKMSGRVFDFIKKNPQITIHELAREIGVAERTIQRATKTLQNEKKLKRVGGRKVGKWETKKD